MRKTLLLIAIAAIALSACGRKEPPQAIADGAPPTLVAVEHVVAGNSLKLDIKMSGGSRGIGYQIDRAEIDPHCNCPGIWRRHYEELPQAANFKRPSIPQLINLKSFKTGFAFRVRAVDALGRFSEWSPTIRARSEEFFK